MADEFLGRPLNPGVSDCWTKFLRELNAALPRDGNCRQWFKDILGGLQRDFFAALAQKGQEKIAEFRKMCLDYRELWRAGKVGSPEMRALLVRLRNWLKDEGLFSLDDPKLQAIAGNRCARPGNLPTLDCDPDVQALIAALLGVHDRNHKAKG